MYWLEKYGFAVANLIWNGRLVNQTMQKKKLHPPIIHSSGILKFHIAISSLPQRSCPGNWEVCDSTTVGAFSGIGYFFAKNIYNELKIPVGLINSSWGGTNIETWISREGFESSEEFKEMIAGMPRINLDSLSKIKVQGQ